jgi:transketolase
MLDDNKNTADIINLKELSKVLRKDILNMVMAAREGHIASSFSCIDILSVLYFYIMNINPQHPQWPQRDRFILSKGHAACAQYAVLARRGYFPVEKLKTIGQKDSMFGGHPDKDKIPGVEVSTGSLGHGLSIGSGMALAAKKDNEKHRVFVVLGDGECQEGTVWEAAMFAAMHKLDNLVAIIDYNKQQAIGYLDKVIHLNPLAEKWQAFGWNVEEVSGHDFNELLNVFSHIPFEENKPSLVIAHTIKGKGVSFMEKILMWHARATTQEEFRQAVYEIEEGN